ncbi:hypothetical protein Pmar_PMAR014941, partial [Perkinsus marinus ATCC 50983]
MNNRGKASNYQEEDDGGDVGDVGVSGISGGSGGSGGNGSNGNNDGNGGDDVEVLANAIYSDQDDDSEDDDEWEPEDDAAWLSGLEDTKPVRNQTVVHNVITKCREMLKMLKFSGKAARIMEDVRSNIPDEEKANLNYTIDTPTHWNSTVVMLEMVLKNEASFDQFQAKVKADKLQGQIWKTVCNYGFATKDYENMRDIVK